jgi:hypothetical protein
MNTTNQTFWKDNPEASSLFPSKKEYKPFYLYFSTAIRAIILIAGIILTYKSPIALLIFVVIFGFPFAIRVYLLVKAKNISENTNEIQNLAREKVGALHIGSAIHVAGHPLLQREQPIVLALVSDSLNFYAYENSTPLDTIPLKNIQGVYTVSYDDNRVPHIDAIDSVAQALQLTFLWGDQPCTCLFRRMRKMKAIDWYHAIQQVRLQFGLAK